MAQDKGLNPGVLSLIDQIIERLNEKRFSQDLYVQIMDLLDEPPDHYNSQYALLYGLSRLLYSMRDGRDWRHYLGQFFDEIHSAMKFPLEKIVEIFKKHINQYVQHEFKFVFNPQWRSGTLVALANGYIKAPSSNDYIDKMNDALQDEGLNDEGILEFLHSHNRLIAIWIAINAI